MAQSCSTVPVDVLRDLNLGLVRHTRLRTLAYDNRLDSLRILHKHPIQNVTLPSLAWILTRQKTLSFYVVEYRGNYTSPTFTS
ncbi:hypothetical protein OSTOST_18186, partial [Ostertagia ostertagi]